MEQCTEMHCTALHCTALHCTALQYFALLCTTFHSPVLLYTWTPCSVLHYFALLLKVVQCTVSNMVAEGENKCTFVSRGIWVCISNWNPANSRARHLWNPNVSYSIISFICVCICIFSCIFIADLNLISHLPV